jgi:FdhD protein
MTTPVRRYRDGRFTSRPDAVAGEEPLEIRVDGTSLAVTMRTPGADVELVHGYLHAEGVIADAQDVESVRYCQGVDDEGRNTYNVVDVALRAPSGSVPGGRRELPIRSVVTSSACGVCGTATIEALAKRVRHPLTPGPVFDPSDLCELPQRLREQQKAFARTGGLHGAALVGSDGTLDTVREDVGRHNAVDKVIGAALLAGRVPGGDLALVTSSRASFELVQKAVLAGIGMLVAVSAPSSLAVELSRSTGLTLVGFTSANGFNLYSGPERIRSA